MLPPLLLLVHNRPEDVGVLPDGDAAPDERDGPAPAVLGLTLRQALRTPAFYIICGGLSSLSMLVTALHFYQVSILEAHGLTAQTASRLFAISAMTMVAMMPVIGRMLDRFRTEWMFAGGLVVMTLSLLSAAAVTDLTTAVIYAVVFGLNNAVTMTFFSFMWPRYFGRRHLGSIQGTGQMISVIGASVGPLPLGYWFDLYGAYNPMLIGLALLPAVMAVVVLFLRAPDLSAARD
jgi:MFS family permease